MRLALAVVVSIAASDSIARAACKDELIVSAVYGVEKTAVVLRDREGNDIRLAASEQLPGEKLVAGVAVTVYCDAVGVLTRRSPKLVEKLFALDVAEIASGVVVVKAIAREPGVRTKIAVADTDGKTDPVAALVGAHGKIVKGVVGALGEPIDIVPWSADQPKFVTAAMAPAVIKRIIVDEASHRMELVVPDAEVSAAIGKKGVNVRLAAQLTGWRLDVHSASNVAKLESAQKQRLTAVLKSAKLSPDLVDKLFARGWRSPEDLANAKPAELVAEIGIDEAAAKRLIVRAARAPRLK